MLRVMSTRQGLPRANRLTCLNQRIPWARKSKENLWSKKVTGVTQKAKKYRQGYLSTVKERTVRVRTIEDQSLPDDQRNSHRGRPPGIRI